MSAVVTPSAGEASPAERALRRWLRIAFTIASLVALIYFGYEVTKIIQVYREFDGDPVIPSLAYTDAVKGAIAQKLDSAKALIQGSMLAFAVLWGLILAKKGEGKLVLRDVELVMFLVANICFVASWYCYAEYADAMAGIQALGGIAYQKPENQTIMDFRDPRINSFLDWQYNLSLAAVVVTGLTLVSAHVLKETTPCPENSPPSGSPC